MERLSTPNKKCSKVDLFRWLRWDITDQGKLDSYDILRRVGLEAWRHVYSSSNPDSHTSSLQRRRRIGRKDISHTGNAMRVVIQIVPLQERLLLRNSKPLMLHVLYHSWSEFRKGQGSRESREKTLMNAVASAVKTEKSVETIQTAYGLVTLERMVLPIRNCNSLPSMQETGLLLTPNAGKKPPSEARIKSADGEVTADLLAMIEQHREKRAEASSMGCETK
ncbi:MAG: hypothetical protein Q9224_004910 [Gallowayella concinna]